MPTTTRFEVKLTPEAVKAAAEFTAPECLAEYARVELISAGLADVDPLRCAGAGEEHDMVVLLHFKLGGRHWCLSPHAAATWEVGVFPTEGECTPPMPAYELVFTDRAKLAAHQHDLPMDYVELQARLALARCEPEDAGCALFAVPVLEVGFRAWPLDGNGSKGGRVEIDLNDAA
jgi:hypothetical protein